MALRVIFMGTPDFALPALKAIHKSRHQIVAVYTQPPRPADRLQVIKTPVHRWGQDHQIPVHTPENFKDPADLAVLKNHKADIAVVAAYGLLLPEAVLTAPRLGCINIHASLLPRWRGAAPIQYAILKGDKETGISIMQMDKGLDTGPVLAAEGIPLAKDATAGTLHDKLADLGAKMIVAVLDNLDAGTLKPQPQDNMLATLAPKFKKAEARIDWTKPAIETDRRVRAFNPFPGAFFEHQGKRFKVLEGRAEDSHGAPGEVLDDNLLIGTGDASYRILKIQREGRKPVTTKEFLRGVTLAKGLKLS